MVGVAGSSPVFRSTLPPPSTPEWWNWSDTLDLKSSELRSCGFESHLRYTQATPTSTYPRQTTSRSPSTPIAAQPTHNHINHTHNTPMYIHDTQQYHAQTIFLQKNSTIYNQKAYFPPLTNHIILNHTTIYATCPATPEHP